MVKTRDVWSYCVILFGYLMYPSLVRYPLAMMSCRSVGGALYLRVDSEVLCWKNEHLQMIGLVAGKYFKRKRASAIAYMESTVD